MPQMAPMNWISLYILFLFLFIMMIIINYYSFLYTPKSIKTIKKAKKINWKW
uniref:ATP synthase complex subunit 8 n=1 Tax=Ceratopus sp. CG351 TaxID=2480753 RepID=A0A3G2JZF2_9CUCU|nr:ATP synthase F0 subunit 8 [Ceratopus sp. CG351]